MGSATASLTNRGLLRTVLAGFVLFLAYRFLAAVFATVLPGAALIFAGLRDIFEQLFRPRGVV